MDTTGSPVVRIGHLARHTGLLLVLAIVALGLLVVVATSLDAIVRPGPADPLLGPFRWFSARGQA
jgi:hypothetical protein